MKVTSATSRPTGCGVPLGCCFYYQEALVFRFTQCAWKLDSEILSEPGLVF
eukprot:m.533121 g.533121  ORF g.533121 m.533121 type:complete len:51 (+) comp57598_c1_seq20:2772-2924(+)